MQNIESWTRQVAKESPLLHLIPPFLETVGPLEIEEAQVKGRVLIIGCGSEFPERGLVATPKSAFGQLRETINSVVCCDPDARFLQLYFDFPITLERFYHFPFLFQKISDLFVKEKFDTVLMFRTVDLGKQIDEGLLEIIAGVLSPGGFFFGSGGRFRYEGTMKTILPPPTLELQKMVELENHSGGYPFDRHIGIVLKKI